MLGLVVLTVVAFMLTLSWLARMRRCQIVAKPTGLSAFTGFGKIHDFVWEEIASVESNGTYLLPNLSSRPKLSLLIPLYLKDQQGFYDYVRQHAPANNPLRLWIEDLPGSKALIFE